jgi:hypothetical protein
MMAVTVIFEVWLAEGQQQRCVETSAGSAGRFAPTPR